MQDQAAPDEARQRVRRETWTWAAILTLLAAALLWWAVASRANLLQRERDRLAGQARAAELNLARNLQGVHLALGFLRDEALSASTRPQRAALGIQLQALRNAMPGVQALLWLDAGGQVLASNVATMVGRSLAQAPLVRSLIEAPDPALLVVSWPLPEGPQGAALHLAVAVPSASTGIAGMMLATLDAAFFSSVLGSVRYAEDMQAEVVHAGGAVLAASPPLVGDRNLAQADSPFAAHRAGSARESVVLGAMPGHDGARLVAQRNIRPLTLSRDLPLVLSVSRSLEDVLEPWRRQVVMATSAYLALLAGSWLAIRLLQRRRREMDALAGDRAAQQAAHARQLALALRGADLALWDAELPGGRMSVNERWYTIIGLQPGELTPDHDAWQSRLHPDDKVAVLASLQAHLRGLSESFEATYRMRHRDGHWLWILDRARVVERDASGAPRRIVGTHMDVSAGMQAREALRDREAQLSSMADALPGPVARLDREGRYIFVNATYQRWFGLRPQELLGRRRDEAMAAHAADLLAPHIERCLSGEAITMDSVALTLQGPRQVMVALVPDRDAQGGVRGCFIVATDITVRKQAEDALRLSEQKSRALFDALRSGVMVYAADTGLRDANPAACSIVGQRLEELRGRRADDPIWNFLDEDGSPLAPERHPVSLVVTAGRALRDRVMGIRRVGEAEPLWVLCSAFPLHGEAGALLEVVLAMADFTERKVAVEALRRSEARWRLAGRLARLGGWHFEAPQGPLEFSTELGELLGAGSMHALTPDEARQLLPDASYALWRQRIEACLVGGAAFDIELEASSVDSRPLHLRVLGEGVRDAGNRLRAVEGAVQDITERKLGEASLRAAQSELAATLAAVPDLLFDVDLQGRIYAQHSPNTQLLLMPPSEFMGRLLEEILPAEAAAVAHSALQQAHAVGHSSGLQYELTLAGGRRWFELSVSRRAVPAGELPRFIVLARDVTERKQDEAERRALERQLREAQKMESIGTLAGGIAHDFNNILAAILGNVALAGEDLPAAHAARSSLDQIRRAGLRARSLVQQILTFSRRQPNELVGQSLRPVVEETVALLRATLPAWVRLQTVLPDAPLLVQADATQLQQVVMNLCTNAWHALPEGRGHIEVGLQALSSEAATALELGDLPSGPCAHLWVRDTGCGMEDSLLERIFDPFFTTKPPGHGTGLGLSVVHGIVRGHMGVVQVQSKPGEGSTFHVYLPAVSPQPLDEGQRGGSAVDATDGSGQHVVYVDDDEVMVLMVQRLLQRAGFQVTTCTAPHQVLTLLREQPMLCDLVVSDYNMPDMSGLELAVELARLRPKLPVIISSGYIADALREQARAAGVRALLKKENTLEELPGLVQQVLAGRDAV